MPVPEYDQRDWLEMIVVSSGLRLCASLPGFYVTRQLDTLSAQFPVYFPSPIDNLVARSD